jgi:hypothetical protein
MCVHAHILRALEVFSVIATTADLHTNTPASEALLCDSNTAGDSDEEKAFVIGLLGLDTDSDEDDSSILAELFFLFSHVITS